MSTHGRVCLIEPAHDHVLPVNHEQLMHVCMVALYHTAGGREQRRQDAWM